MPPSPITAQDIQALIAFLPLFQHPQFKSGEWITPEGQNDWFKDSRDLEAFILALDQHHWIISLNWIDWLEKIPYATSPKWIAKASLTDLQKLLTALVRCDCYHEGAMASAVQNGIITTVLRRMEELLEDPRQVNLDENANTTSL